MKNFLHITLWVSVIYLAELGLGYLISLIWVKDLGNIFCNAMLLSIGVLLHCLYCLYKSNKY